MRGPSQCTLVHGEIQVTIDEALSRARSIPIRWTEAQVERFRDAEKTKHQQLVAVAVVSVLFLLAVLVAPHAYFSVLLCAFVLWAILWYGLNAPRRNALIYNGVKAYWEDYLARSAPGVVMAASVPLRPGEIVHYVHPSQRYVERHVGQRISTVSRSKGTITRAIVGEIVAGPVGAIIGGATSSKVTTGTAQNIFNVVAVDAGELILTNERAVFLGERDTIEIPNGSIMRYTLADDRLVLEHGARESGEAYSVDPVLLRLCMVRRARRRDFTLPAPPMPLPLSEGRQLIGDPRSAQQLGA